MKSLTIKLNNDISIASSLNKKQIYKISSLINEGISVENGSIEIKKKYLERVKMELMEIICKNSITNTPRWILPLDVPKVIIGEDNNVDPSYPDEYVVNIIQLLKDIRTEYYLNQQLKESQKQSCHALYALIISFITLIVTSLASYLSIRTTGS